MRGPRPPRMAIATAEDVYVTDSSPSPSLPIRLVSFNVRYATSKRMPLEKPWAVRCPKIGASLRFHASNKTGGGAFLCLQEVLFSQVLDLHDQLGRADWAYIGRGRDDGHEAGELSPVFYQPAIWQCLRETQYWLSETPEKPSRGWDAALPRIVTVGLFGHRQTGTRVVVMSTHFDHLGVKARKESAKLIVQICEKWSESESEKGKMNEKKNERSEEKTSEEKTSEEKTSERSEEKTSERSEEKRSEEINEERSEDRKVANLFLGGDFNSRPESEAYQTMTRPGGMVDLFTLVPKEHHHGNQEHTYTSFDEPGHSPTRIDFLFVKNADVDAVRPVDFAVLSNRFDDGVFLSDHRPIVADVEVPVV